MSLERKYAFSVTVDVSCQDAYLYAADPNNLPEWDHSVSDVLVTSDSVFVVYIRACPQFLCGPTRVIYTRLTSVPNEHYVLRGKSAGFESKELFECRALAENQCNVTYTITVKYHGWRRLLTPVVGWRVKRITHAAGVLLKRTLEGRKRSLAV